LVEVIREPSEHVILVDALHQRGQLDADAYADYLMSLSQTGQLSEQKGMKKELDAAQRRLYELATLVQDDSRITCSDGSRMTSTKPYLPSMKRKQKN